MGRRLRKGTRQGRVVSLTVRLEDFTTIGRQKALPHHIDSGGAINDRWGEETIGPGVTEIDPRFREDDTKKGDEDSKVGWR